MRPAPMPDKLEAEILMPRPSSRSLATSASTEVTVPTSAHAEKALAVLASERYFYQNKSRVLELDLARLQEIVDRLGQTRSEVAYIEPQHSMIDASMQDKLAELAALKRLMKTPVYRMARPISRFGRTLKRLLRRLSGKKN